MRYLIIFFLITFSLTSCNNLSLSDKYQIASSTDGNMYRLDKVSGDVWLIRGNSMEKIQFKDLRLNIGNRYIGEDTYSFTYLGKGQFGDIKTLENYDPLGIR